MERHHLDMCIMILNSEGNAVLSNISPREYEQTMTVLKKAILATDIATYIRIRNDYVVRLNCVAGNCRLLHS
jgi:dual 3',5'-cyclic-AMP and -GMP phosphodiesterase 11